MKTLVFSVTTLCASLIATITSYFKYATFTGTLQSGYYIDLA